MTLFGARLCTFASLHRQALIFQQRPKARSTARCTPELVWDIETQEEEATQDSDLTAARVVYPTLRSALYQQVQASLMMSWRSSWNESPTGKALREIDPRLPTKKVLGLHSNHKPTSSLIVQLRTQKIGLKAFLYSWHIPGHTDGWCECGSRFCAWIPLLTWDVMRANRRVAEGRVERRRSNSRPTLAS